MQNTNFIPKELSQQIKNQIDNYCSDFYDNGPRSHLGASKIGENCSRALWYGFRWIAHKKHSGQQQRLFQRGHFEEPRFVSYLEAIGFTVQMFDAEAVLRGEQDKGKMQIRIDDCKYHFGGSVDGIAEHPLYGKFLAEFKTQGIGKKGDKFDKLVKEGVKLNKPVHYAQMCVYGYKLNLKYAIYMAVNKNDDDLYVEVVELDFELAKTLLKKAEMIIYSQTPPNGVSLSAAYYECQFCDYKAVCHQGADSSVNCRSCSKCKPVEDGNWFCEQWNSIVPKECIKDACQEWRSIV